jgi:hypothetical protein
MAVFPVVKGVALRATKVNSCGLPQAGPANRLVTTGFVTAKLSAVLKAANELTQENAEGKVCVEDRTPPERKYYTLALELCNVNPALIGMFTGWQQVTDWDDSAIGFRDQEETIDDYGVALEIWTGGRSDDDCPTPVLDSVFSAGGSGKKYGYLLVGGTEWTLGDINIGASVATFTLSGISIAMPQWGRGPYNVAGTDGAGTPGRLLSPVGQDEHFTLFRTPVAPPEVTPGSEAAPLAIASLFTAPNYYFGGPSNAPAADIAPEQGSSEAKTLTISGVPTGGTFTLTFLGRPTTAIPFNATASAIKAALVALDDSFDASDWTVVATGTLPTGSMAITLPEDDSTFSASGAGLTGGTAPAAHIA